MKLKITPFSQRDQRWASILLGYNTNPVYNIGSYGCLITCLASYLSSLGGSDTSQTVNQKLKDNNGFAAGTGNFIWSKSTVLGLTQTYLSPYYDYPATDQAVKKAKELLDQGYPLLTEVDFNLATVGEEMHFVLLCGYENDTFFCMDPWLGQVTTLDNYGGFKRGVMQFRAYNKNLPVETQPTQSPELAACLKQHTELVNKCNENENEIEGLKAQIMTYENFQKQVSSTLNCPNQPTDILGQITKLLAIEDQLRTTLQTNETLKKANENLTAERDQEKQRADGALLANKDVSEALGKVTDDNKQLQTKLDQCITTNKFEPIANILGFWICKLKGGDTK